MTSSKDQVEFGTSTEDEIISNPDMHGAHSRRVSKVQEAGRGLVDNAGDGQARDSLIPISRHLSNVLENKTKTSAKITVEDTYSRNKDSKLKVENEFMEETEGDITVKSKENELEKHVHKRFNKVKGLKPEKVQSLVDERKRKKTSKKNIEKSKQLKTDVIAGKNIKAS